MRKEIKELLSEALQKSATEPQNVRIAGRTGIGKTTIVREWFEEHPEVKKIEFHANCRTRSFHKVLEDNGSITPLDFSLYFTTDEIRKFNQKETVLFIDNFDLTHNDARDHIMNLIKNRNAVYQMDGEIKHLENLKMIIAVAFEIGGSHFGYDPLDKDNVEAFEYVLELKS